MFFARFEDAEDQSVTTPQQRLEALKQKIAAKQKQHSKDDSSDNFGVINGERGVKSEDVSRKHPKKRRKISGAEECEETKPKKKKKKHSDEKVPPQECKRKKEESEAINGDCKQEVELNSKKRKKKKKVVTDNVEGNVNGGSENDKPRKKKGQKLETSENSHTKEKVDGEIVDGNDAPKQKKKKKKKLVDQQEDLNNGDEHEGQAVEQPEESAADHGNDQTEENAEDKTMEEEEEEVKEIEEEWTILGKHKTLQKVGHVKRDLPDWIVNSEIIDAEFDNVCSVEEFGLLDQCIVDVLTAMEIKSLFPGLELKIEFSMVF